MAPVNHPFSSRLDSMAQSVIAVIQTHWTNHTELLVTARDAPQPRSYASIRGYQPEWQICKHANTILLLLKFPC
jgi:hypothetical protein